MRKKTARHTPDSPKASPNQPSGLIAKGQQPGESVQEECVLDNRSHRTSCALAGRLWSLHPKGREGSARACAIRAVM